MKLLSRLCIKPMRVRCYVGLAVVSLLICLFVRPSMAIHSPPIPSRSPIVQQKFSSTRSALIPVSRLPVSRSIEAFSSASASAPVDALQLQPTKIAVLTRIESPVAQESLAESFLTETLLEETVLENTLRQGQRLYEAGQWTDTIALLEQAIAMATQSGDIITQMIALRNLSLVYQHLRHFDQATQAIDTARLLLERNLDTHAYLQSSALYASILDVWGGIFFHRGQFEQALQPWKNAASIYDEIGAVEETIQARIHQAQALQQLGFYRKTIALLTPIIEQYSIQSDSPQRAIAHRSLGDALRFVGDLRQSQTHLQLSVDMAYRLQRQDLAHSAQLSLAHTFQALGDNDSAFMLYQNLTQTASGDLRVQAMSHELALLINRGQQSEAQSLWPTLQSQFDTLPPNHSTLFARINVVQHFIRLGIVNQPSRSEQAEQLAIAIQQAQMLGDRRSESYAVGTLGSLYEKAGDLSSAQSLSEQASTLAQTTHATDIGYLWQWQLGRIYKALGDRSSTPQTQHQHYQNATSAYSNAVDSLQQLRTDLVAVNAQVQVSFQESVEPIHRELVSLLLDPNRNDTTPDDIEKARIVIESLQLAELDNFFREACLDTDVVDIDQLDTDAAVIYPIMLRDRLEVVVSFPNHTLKHYTTPVSRETVEALVEQLRQHLTLRIGNRFRPGMSQMYDWLIEPAMPDLQTSQVNTLVFVLDGALRNIPMAALYNREANTFLVESFSIAVTPGLQLVNPQPIQEQNLTVLTGALSEARQGFSALPNVVPEVEQIQATVPTQVLLNERFTAAAFQTALQSNAEPIVHLATHGKFSSNKDQTFLLTWDSQLSITALNDVLRVSPLNLSGPIELLVLSACQTAAGDKEAALGLAGMAVRAGARSTIATLWHVNDEATALLMEKLYDALSSRQVSKAKALQQAQLKILADPQFRRHPYYWAPFILVGNWL